MSKSNRYALFIVSYDGGVKLYWNSTLKSWMKNKVSASPHSETLGDGPMNAPRRFGIQAEPFIEEVVDLEDGEKRERGRPKKLKAKVAGQS